jgi:hypothetical protein
MRRAAGLLILLVLVGPGCRRWGDPLASTPSFSIGITNQTGHNGVHVEAELVCDEIRNITLMHNERVSENCLGSIGPGAIRVRAFKEEVNNWGDVVWQYDRSWTYNPPRDQEEESRSIELVINPWEIEADVY